MTLLLTGLGSLLLAVIAFAIDVALDMSLLTLPGVLVIKIVGFVAPAAANERGRAIAILFLGTWMFFWMLLLVIARLRRPDVESVGP